MYRLLELLKSVTGYDIDTDTCIVDKPIATDGEYNTVVNICGRLQTGTYGQRDFLYNRMLLDNKPIQDIVDKDYKTVLDLLPIINRDPIFTYAINLSNEVLRRQAILLREDVIDDKLEDIRDGDILNIQANPDSYLFCGNLKVRLV